MNSPPQSDSLRANGRDTAGRFTAGNSIGPRFNEGNTAALIHGGRRMQLGRGTALDEAERMAVRDLVIADLGGATRPASRQGAE